MLTRTPRLIDIRTLQYIRERWRSILLWPPKQKNYNTKVVWNSVPRLLTKENFKRQTVCDKFNKIWSNCFQTKLKVTSNKTRNGFIRRLRTSWLLLAHGGQRQGWLWRNDRFKRTPKTWGKVALTLVRVTIQPWPSNPISPLSTLYSLFQLCTSNQWRLLVK
jgi:hypothetical protein